MLEMSEEICLKLGMDAHSEKKQRHEESIVALDAPWQAEVKCKTHMGFSPGT